MLCDKLLRVCRMLCLPLGVVMMAPANAGADARIVAHTTPYAGRIHLDVEVTVSDDSRLPRFSSVRRTESGVDVAVAVDVMEGFFGPEVQVRRLPLTLDNLPPGSYPLRLVDAEDDSRVLDVAQIEIDASPSQLLPAHAARQWPADAARFDDVWLLLDLPDECPALELQGFADSAERIFIRKEPGACPAAVLAPTLHAVRLGNIEPQDSTKQLHLPVSDDVSESLAGSLQLRVADRLSPRLAGLWHHPALPGQAVQVQFAAPDRLMLTWITFTADGRRELIFAQGVHAGTGATLQALRTSGGSFPSTAPGSPSVTQAPWGSIDIEFTACDRAEMRWTPSVEGFSSGSLSLSRLASPEALDCGSGPSGNALVPTWLQGPGSYFRLP